MSKNREGANSRTGRGTLALRLFIMGFNNSPRSSPLWSDKWHKSWGQQPSLIQKTKVWTISSARNPYESECSRTCNSTSCIGRNLWLSAADSQWQAMQQLHQENKNNHSAGQGSSSTAWRFASWWTDTWLTHHNTRTWRLPWASWCRGTKTQIVLLR